MRHSVVFDDSRLLQRAGFASILVIPHLTYLAMNIQELENCIKSAQAELKALKKYKRLLIAIQKEKAEIAILHGGTPTLESEDPTLNGGTPTLEGEDPTLNGGTPTIEKPEDAPEHQELYVVTSTSSTSLSNLGIRELRNKARGVVPGFMRLTKSELLSALATAA